MIPSEILKKIRTIQIKTSRRVDSMLAGNWHSAFKGRGMEFEEVRPYQVGDDVRAIDWNVTARYDEPFVKLFREERELIISLLVDLSPSQSFGTSRQTKRELVAELGATLAMSAIRNNDKVGLTLFTDLIEKSVRPAKGSRHVLRLIRELLYCSPVGNGTDIKLALDHLMRTSRRRAVVFLVSDFQSTGFSKTLRIAAKRHELIPVLVEDPREFELPNVGLIRLQDSETGEFVLVDTAVRKNRELYRKLALERRANLLSEFKKLKTTPLILNTAEDMAEPVRRYFHAREARTG